MISASNFLRFSFRVLALALILMPSVGICLESNGQAHTEVFLGGDDCLHEEIRSTDDTQKMSGWGYDACLDCIDFAPSTAFWVKEQAIDIYNNLAVFPVFAFSISLGKIPLVEPEFRSRLTHVPSVESLYFHKSIRLLI